MTQQPQSFTPDQVKRYSRHIIMGDVGSSGQRKLMQSKALIIGAGGLGLFWLLFGFWLVLAGASGVGAGLPPGGGLLFGPGVSAGAGLSDCVCPSLWFANAVTGSVKARISIATVIDVIILITFSFHAWSILYLSAARKSI